MFCKKIIKTRKNSKYDPEDFHTCYLPAGHLGKCEEYPYLNHMGEVAEKVRNKIIRDATKTTGASWKSTDAGPNRISRWTMLLSDEELAALNIDMSALKPWVVAKLREKAATYEDCMEAAQKLTWSAYGMVGAPEPDDFTRKYLENLFGPIRAGSTTCLICRAPLEFNLFSEARRGKAEIETAHATPRSHTKDNVGFAHRHCNIAQGDKDLDVFLEWMIGIVARHGKAVYTPL